MAKEDQELPLQPLRPPLLTRLKWHFRDGLDYFNESNFPRVMYHLLSIVYFCFILYLTYYVLPLPGHWTPGQQSDKVPVVSQDLNKQVSTKYCHYHWYSVEEICMILERFDAIVFVGDSSIQAIYNGLSILLRQDLTHGALRTWDMDKERLRQCSCDNQFTSQACSEHFITSSNDLTSHHLGRADQPYLCSRTAHSFLETSTSPAPSFVIEKFKQLVPRVARSNYHPIAIVHGLSPNIATPETAIASLEEFLALADASHRKTPMLWIGPTASGHTEIRGRKGNQEIWDFDRRLALVAEDNDVEVLRMWNMTVQTTSWDGMRFGEKIAVTQAMMVLNWLGRLPSS
ncbi:hypothetical protein AYO20_01417 [Fonsecaea nubica]|uniref:Uncharacterized protein n=1 Tax=Fonsecaea nubica TaxID=856822 RepID=A0A178DAB7_9EURO|nr:hypothetical protein AYO20_01417 [Fonsecaea nubica]OAL39099.1 hypothetical protein AYO20_01417 [Fonsecaea nubica]